MSAWAALAADAGRATPLLSEQWFRVAELRPRLHDGVQADRILVRGQPWVVLASPDGLRRVRLDPAAYALAGRCDGRLTLQQLWEILLREQRDDAPTQDELVLHVMHLYREGFLAFDAEPDFGAMAPLDAGAPRPTPATRGSLLAWRLPLGSPQRWLQPLQPLARLLFSRGGAIAFALLMVLGLAATVQQAGLVADFTGRWLHSPHVLLMTWLVFPVLKLLHETAHALAVARHGGIVPQWGLTLLVFTPVPYVDASAAEGFAARRHRFTVSAAGAMAELSVAALAIAGSTLLQPGLLRDLLLVVFMLGALSSLLVNANPLLRFDGYHALCDVMELPNLASRSARHWRQLITRALGLPAEPALAAARGEHAWWWFYAPASLACRIVLSVGIAAWIGAQHFWAGVAVSVLLAWGLVLQPALRGLRVLGGLHLEPERAGRSRRRVLAALAAVALLLAVPVPDVSVVRGVVWLPDDAMVRAQAPGFVDEVLARDGQPVRAGDVLLRLSNPALQAEAIDAEARLAALEVELHQAYAEDSARAQRVGQEIDAATAARERIAGRVEHLVLRAPADGRLSLPHAQDLPGRHLAQGAVVGTLLRRAPPGAPASASASAPAGAPAGQWQVLVAMQAEQATEQVAQREGAIAVDLGLPGSPGVAATLQRDARAAGRQLPSAALADRFGGPIVTDPADTQGLTAARDVVLLTLSVPAPPGVERPPVGKRVWVRFDHGYRALGALLARRAQQSVLVHFAPWR
jgi:putative peptide zinc metalloprotease protein